jgi:putative RNA 2'-phosphotransferase
MDYRRLSKFIAYILRHAPWKYELELDDQGWVEVEQLLEALRESREWQQVNEEDLRMIIDQSEKKRYELSNGKIRALYGHSIPQKIVKEAKEPPEILYHGTARHFLDSIKANGLLPKGRQYVHLSIDTNIALEVGRRRDDNPVLLKIAARKAWEDGISFYPGNEKIWLADKVPGKYIEQ